MTLEPSLLAKGARRSGIRVHSRWRLLVGVLILALGLSSGWLLARRFESPEQRQAKARPPAPAALWYPMKQGTLVDSASGRGTVQPSSTEALALTEADANAVVTDRTVTHGDMVTQGTEVAEVNGAPVFAFSGSFPFYRSLGPKMTGPDVAQLQRGLLAAGHVVPSDELGSYGAATVQAVKSLYAGRGYTPQPSIPLSSLVVAKSLPERVISNAAVGDRVSSDAPLVTLGQGALIAEAVMDAGVVARMKPGMSARIYSSGALMARGTVVGLPKAADTSRVQVAPRRPLSGTHLGRAIVIVVDIEAVARRALLVPSRAVVSEGDNSGAILVKRATGSRERVPVHILGELGGVTAVAPEGNASLSTRDDVKVG